MVARCQLDKVPAVLLRPFDLVRWCCYFAQRFLALGCASSSSDICLLPTTLIPLGATPRLVSIQHMAWITIAARSAKALLAFDNTDLLVPPGDVHLPNHTPLSKCSFHGGITRGQFVSLSLLFII